MVIKRLNGVAVLNIPIGKLLLLLTLYIYLGYSIILLIYTLT